MIKLQRVVFAALGSAVIAVACAAPTDPVEATDEAPAAEATGDATAFGTTASALVGGSDQGSSPEDLYNDGHPGCIHADLPHCQRNERGWRWIQRPYGSDQDGHRHRRCCVRVERPSHPHF